MGIKRVLAAMSLALAFSAPAAAVVIGFSPSTADVTLGSRFDVEIVVSELSTPAGSEIVSAFDLDVLYDAAVLNAVEFLFSDALGIPDTDTFTAGIFSAGRVDLANISLLANVDLFARQGDSVVLGRLMFDAIGVGVSLVSFDTGPEALNLVGSNPFGSLPVTGAGNLFATVRAPVAVSEPSMLLLCGIGLLALLVFGDRRERR